MKHIDLSPQRQIWDNLHKKGKLDHSFEKQTDFAEEVQNVIPPKSKILELGCGVGNDSFYFAQKGHHVLATDFSHVAIGNNKKRFRENNLQFEVLDMSKPMNFLDNAFDVVYARLSLHYFTDKVTKQIVREIHRILKPNGLLCFLCKSTQDPLYGKSKQIEKDMFDENGHVRHFFSENYVKECLEGMYKIQQLQTGQENFYNSPSAFIKVIAINIT